MLIYRCGHCQADLGPVLDGEPEPACVDHPQGQVVAVEVDSDDP
jgi:hypothetical protein